MKGTVESTKPSMSPFVSVLVPCLNEENTLRSLVERVEKTLDGLQNIQWEIIFIDDGSTDETGSIIDQLSQEIPWVKAYHHSTTIGKSAAIMNGFYHSKGNIIILLDADLQFFPEDIPAILSEMSQKGLDVVNGWRKERKDPLSRRMASRLFNSFASTD
jgi:glycosyltransferase involved in cell wall biosynthesis